MRVRQILEIINHKLQAPNYKQASISKFKIQNIVLVIWNLVLEICHIQAQGYSRCPEKTVYKKKTGNKRSSINHLLR